jgi:endonuclease-3
MPAPQPEARAILRALAKAYPDARCGLDFEGPFQLAVATLLSAQCTDKAVNRATPPLFARYPGPRELARAKASDVEALIRSLGLFRTKARHLVAMAQALEARHGGQVPAEMKALTALPGIGRKTANVILSNAFGLPGLAVDTHVLRVGRRLGLHSSADPVKAEAQLCALAPKASWGLLSHRLISLGRGPCRARKPLCAACALAGLCPSRED